MQRSIVKRRPGKPDKGAPISHWCQKLFWFSAGLSLLLTTSSFTWRVWQGKPASIEWGNLRINSQQAETLVAGAKDRLIAIRATLNNTIEIQKVDLMATELDNLDEVMRSLGVAESALRKQQQVSRSDDWGDTGGLVYDGPSSNPYVDDQGFYWGGDGFATPKTTSGQRRTPKPEQPK
jgi:hypothetical protein